MINGRIRFFEGENAGSDHQACADDGGTGAIHLEAWKPSEGKHEIGSEKNYFSGKHVLNFRQ